MLVSEVSAGEEKVGSIPPGEGMVIENLSAWFGPNKVLYDISLTMKEKKVTAVIGPSGCGKSTLVRCINRMHEVVPGARVEGKIFWKGWDLYAPGEDPVVVRRRIGMVFQKPNPFPTMSVYDNVVAGLRLSGVRGKFLDGIVEKNLRMAALWDEVKGQLHKSGASLSGGQQQRLCIARALAMEPEVLLMDEPCSALDPLATAKIEELIHQLKKNYTIIIVTHNMQQAARTSEYTAFLYLGELIEYDTTEKIFTNPSNLRTENYITGRFG